MDGFSDSWYDHLQKNQCSDFFTCKNHNFEWQNWLKLLNIITLSRLQNEIQHQTLLRYIYQRGDCRNVECYNISTELWKALGLWLCPHIQTSSRAFHPVAWNCECTHASTTIKTELAALALCTCVRFTGLQYERRMRWWACWPCSKTDRFFTTRHDCAYQCCALTAASLHGSSWIFFHSPVQHHLLLDARMFLWRSTCFPRCPLLHNLLISFLKSSSDWGACINDCLWKLRQKPGAEWSKQETQTREVSLTFAHEA